MAPISSNTISTDSALAHLVRDASHPLIGSEHDTDPIIDSIGDRSIVLLGEASHGTHEFYVSRVEITRRLINEKGFAAIAIEGDFPSVLSVNRFVNERTSNTQALDALRPFQRFPMWMWRNSVFLNFIEWLWVHNRKETTENRVGIFGIDLYSLYESIHEVIRFLETVDHLAAERARILYSCFDHHKQDPIHYGRFVRVGAHPSCEEKALQALEQFYGQLWTDSKLDLASSDPDEVFFAKQNAELVKNAESYYRNLFSPVVNTWNVRDRHMAETISNLLTHLKEHNKPEKVVIWAHNSHIGDDRATEMGTHGQWNIGQLLRERYPGKTYHLGYTTYEGTVTAASQWDHPPELKTVLPGLPDSYETLFHRTELDAFFLNFADDRELAKTLNEPRLERAIGVVYSPETERVSHYFQARIADQYDGIVHFDVTREVEPLDHLAVQEVTQPSEIQF
jgi:erythromycin esterase-like protein